MNNKICFLFAFGWLLLLAQPAWSQTPCETGGRFVDEMFSVKKLDPDDLFGGIVYGENINFNGALQQLRLNIREPENDTMQKRPLIILASGGSFQFQSKASPDITYLCDYFTKRGYVTANMDYRVLWEPENERQGTLAVLRATHDMRAAVRFFRKDAATDNKYRIDPDMIFVGGTSAGGVTAVHLAYLTEMCEIPEAIINDTAGIGGIEGNSGNPGYPSHVNGVINLCGMVADTNFIYADDAPILSMHGTKDGTVPYGTDIIRGILPVDGSASIHERANNIGLFNRFYTWYGAGHTPYLAGIGIEPKYMDTTQTFIRDFLAHIVCNRNTYLRSGNTTYNCGMETSVTELNIDSELDLKVFPNPSPGGDIHVSLRNTNNRELQFDLLDATGKVLNTVLSAENMVTLSDKRLTPGVYILQVTDNVNRFTEKVVIY